MKAKRDKAELLADRLDIPADALGLTKLSLCGRSRLLIENHGGKTRLIVRGDNLMLKAMTGSDMLICGRIISLEFE